MDGQHENFAAHLDLVGGELFLLAHEVDLILGGSTGSSFVVELKQVHVRLKIEDFEFRISHVEAQLCRLSARRFDVGQQFVDLATLAKLLGHRDVSTTVNHYAIFTDTEVREKHEQYSPVKKLHRKK